MASIDLRKLVGGRSLSFPCTITRNGVGITVTALIDTGANGYAFIDRTCAERITKKLGLQRSPLEREIPVTDYKGQNGSPIKSVLWTDLWIDGRLERAAPMLELDTGPENEVLLGRKWLAYHGILPDARRHRLVWPEGRTRDFGRSGIIDIPYSALAPQTPNPEHQRDADRRDRAMDLQDQRARAQKALRQQQCPRAILKRAAPVDLEPSPIQEDTGHRTLSPPAGGKKHVGWSVTTWEQDTLEGYRKMNRALADSQATTSPR